MYIINSVEKPKLSFNKESLFFNLVYLLDTDLLKGLQCTFLTFEEEFFATHLYYQQKHHAISKAPQYACDHRQLQGAGESAHLILQMSPDHPSYQLLDLTKVLQFPCGPSDRLSEEQCFLRSQAHRCRLTGSQTQEMLEQENDGQIRRDKNVVANSLPIWRSRLRCVHAQFNTWFKTSRDTLEESSIGKP